MIQVNVSELMIPSLQNTLVPSVFIANQMFHITNHIGYRQRFQTIGPIKTANKNDISRSINELLVDLTRFHFNTN